MLDMMSIFNLDVVVIDVRLAIKKSKLDRLKPFADFFSLCTFLTTFQIVPVAWKNGEANKFVSRNVVGVDKFGIPLVSHRKKSLRAHFVHLATAAEQRSVALFCYMLHCNILVHLHLEWIGCVI